MSTEPTSAIPAETFEQLGLRAELLSTLKEIGYEKPTEVQRSSFLPAISGKDLIVQSRTGSGKTAAFLLPLCHSLLNESVRHVQALILVPTRELALQVATEAGRLAAGMPLRSIAIYGGAAIQPQIDTLAKGVHLVVGTPGRVLDHMRRGSLDCRQLEVLVLDEADEMLSMGFAEELNAILGQLPATKQTLLFSATLSDDVEKMATRNLKTPQRVLLSGDNISVSDIQHSYYMVSGADRLADLVRVIEFEEVQLGIVFCNTRDDTARVAEYLAKRGYGCEGISGDLSQSERENVMKLMRDGKLQVLAATDIAARGIDIVNVTHVVNYSFPESADVYVHRTGRTGRAGKAGKAISLVSPREIGSFYYLKLIHKITPVERQLPSDIELQTKREVAAIEKLRQRYEGKVATSAMLNLVRRLWQAADGESLAAFALAELTADTVAHSVRSGPPEKAVVTAVEQITDDSSGGTKRERHQEDRPSRHLRVVNAQNGAPPVPASSDGAREDSRRRRPPRREKKTQETCGAMTYTTPDGEVEFYETWDPDMSPTKAGQPRSDRTRLYLNVGKRQGVHSADLTQFVQVEAQLTTDELGRIELHDRHAYLNVPSAVADRVISQLNGKLFGDRTIRIERARP